MTEEITKDIRVAFTDYMDKVDTLAKQNNELKQENRELKAYKDINEDFKKAWDELNEKYKQLRSALEEIREIAKDIIENDVYENSDVKAEKILTKINEVFDLS